ncbi:MAG: CHASE domain-containing protein [Deltaproteobacteria bacterium]|nr:CHASE domain-containing protein [Deltaproteobacteria bacterium]
MTDRKAPLYWLPVLACAGIIIGTFLLWRSNIASERTHIGRTLDLKSVTIRDTVQDQMESRILALIRMARRWEIQGKPSEREWTSDAGQYVSHYAGYRSIAWADQTLRARWVVPLMGNEALPGRDFKGDEAVSRVLENAKQWRGVAVSAPLKGVDNDKLFAVAVPIFRGDGFEGTIVGFFRTEELFDSILRREEGLGYSIALLSGNDPLYTKAVPGNIEPGWVRELALSPYGAPWKIRVWPARDELRSMETRLPAAILTSGFLVALLLALAIYFGQVSRHRAKAAEGANVELEREIAERKQLESLAERNAAELARSNVELELEVMERKRAEEEARKHSIELARSNAELEQFAYVASHDLQEPLRVIAGYVQLLARRYSGRLDQSADEFISFAVDGATRMQRLINDLLVYSRFGTMSKEFAQVNCKDVFDVALANLDAVIKESGAAVTSAELPVVYADPSQLGQLLQNLIGNAIKFRGKKPPKVHVGAERNGHDWVFSVRDNGIGIDPRYNDKIFVIFQRLHAKNEYPGTGMGLAICRKIVEKHGGRIWVESHLGKGSDFRFTIPEKGVQDDKKW